MMIVVGTGTSWVVIGVTTVNSCPHFVPVWYPHRYKAFVITDIVYIPPILPWRVNV